MMFSILIAFAASLPGGFVFPWWWPAVVGLILGFWKAGEKWKTFWGTFIGAAAAWKVVAVFYQIGNHGLLSGKVATLFHLPNGWWLVGITAMVGGLTAGFGALLGCYLRSGWEPASIPK